MNFLQSNKCPVNEHSDLVAPSFSLKSVALISGLWEEQGCCPLCQADWAQHVAGYVPVQWDTPNENGAFRRLLPSWLAAERLQGRMAAKS